MRAPALLVENIEPIAKLNWGTTLTSNDGDGGLLP